MFHFRRAVQNKKLTFLADISAEAPSPLPPAPMLKRPYEQNIGYLFRFLDVKNQDTMCGSEYFVSAVCGQSYIVYKQLIRSIPNPFLSTNCI